MEQLIERKKRKEERKKRETPKVSDNLDIEGPKRDSSPPKPLEAGDKIRIKSNGLTGEITRINNKRITISVGNIISTIREEEIERISNREYNQSIKSSSKYIGETAEGIQERRLNFKQSIDIRGERLSEAIDIVSRYIDDALMVGAAEVKILHGKGNGILKEEIRKYLKTIGGVVSCEDEDIRYGGSGITIVRLNG